MKQFKGFIVGFIFACLLVVPTTALADNIQAQFNTVNITVDGKNAVKQGENYQLSDGSSVPFSITYKGTTYLPVRKVSELLSLGIDYDNTSKTVKIITSETKDTNDTKAQTPSTTANQATTSQTTTNQSTVTDKASNADTNKTNTTVQDLKAVSSGYSVFNEVTKDVNDAGKKVQHVVGYKEKKWIDVLTSDADIIKNWSQVKWSANGFSKSILYKLDLASNGVIVGAQEISANLGPVKIDQGNNRESITIGDKTYMLSEDVVIYQVTDDDEYKLFSGNLKDKDIVQLFDTDSSKDGYEFVIFLRP
ncbi:hypothetical protein Ami103574_11565 [Aminipila butyrica]|uniref:Copper amine oxidase-like N-terminal domain-containing protein n=1 Tax=Aminipila butyrica TaxID=433296 RepID=A0A858BYE9_9FIRM|nr:stalk domain-containing protein [Aminipila butyrica]QIB69920.1 hypothetical protein Ami103574_11565 [Aminipila butyrica]